MRVVADRNNYLGNRRHYLDNSFLGVQDMASFQTLPNGNVQVRIRKKGHHWSAVFSSLKIAEAEAKKEEQRIERASAGIYANDSKMTLEELIYEWAKWAKIHHKGFEVEKHHLANIPPYLLRLRVKSMPREPFMKYVAELTEAKKSPATIVRRLDLLRSIVNRGIKTIPSLFGIENTIEKIDRPKLPDSHYRERTATNTEIKDLINNSSSKDYPDFLNIALETAARRAEIAGILWENVEFETSTAKILDTKNGTNRRLALSPKAIEILKKRFDERKKDAVYVFPSPKKAGTHLTPASMTKAHNRSLKKMAGTGNKLDLHLHDIRHTSTTNWKKAGFQTFDLMKITGHKSLSSLKRYENTETTEIAQKMAAIHKAKE